MKFLRESFPADVTVWSVFIGFLFEVTVSSPGDSLTGTTMFGEKTGCYIYFRALFCYLSLSFNSLFASMSS
jgi:hypothetical protein